MSTKKLIDNYFNLEELRDKLALENNLVEFKNLYKHSCKILNFNTNNFWNKLNFTTPEVTKKANPIAYHRHQIIKKNIPSPPLTVLNAGFGHCELEKIITNTKLKKYSWHGIDISKKSVDFARSHYSGIFTTSNVTKISYINEKFDCIIASELLEHLYPWDALMTIREFNRLIKNGGMLIVSVPVNENLRKLVIDNSNYNGHLREYTFNILKYEMEISNFKLINSWELYAFKNFYFFKSLIARIFKTHKPNNIIMCMKKYANITSC